MVDTLTSSRFVFSGKARTLQDLAPLLKKGCVLPLFFFSVEQWLKQPNKILSDLHHQFGGQTLIVRSSCQREDQNNSSGAGEYDSVSNIRGRESIKQAINTVIASYGEYSLNDEILVQSMATGVSASGVVMTRDPQSCAPYYIVNYTHGESTDSVTAGNQSVQVFITIKSTDIIEPPPLRGLFDLLTEIEQLTQLSALDIEFAITQEGPVLFQVRPIIGAKNKVDDLVFFRSLKRETKKLAIAGAQVKQFSLKKCALFGLMPDWNPAEMIGVKPRPLAYSLYKELITDVNWSSARFRYGYRDMRDKQLMFQFGGSPYICIPYSFESFIPATLPRNMVTATVKACCESLAANPQLHDKIEFSIIPTCLTASLNIDTMQTIPAFSGLKQKERHLYLSELRKITEHIISLDGPFFSDLRQIPQIMQDLKRLKDARNSDNLQRFRDGLSYAKVVAEIFAGAARAAFIATAIIKTLESEGCVAFGYTDLFVGSAHSVGRTLSEDFCLLQKEFFLIRHGHIRPGTYDIRVPRYDETPDSYFNWLAPVQRLNSLDPQPLNDHVTLQAIQEIFKKVELNVTSVHFLHFAITAIEAREKLKYLYGAFVSETLSALTEWGRRNGLDRNALSFATVPDFISHSEIRLGAELLDKIETNQANWQATQNIRTPFIICEPKDLSSHSNHICTPNFITHERTSAPVVLLTEQKSTDCDIAGRIILIENADPGFDWIFTRGIAGFITAYGGENSHMSIRAREFRMPAAIGVGEDKLRMLASANRLLLDCAACRIQVMS